MSTDQVVFGDSFLNPSRSGHDSLFTFRYSQKPHSLDTSQPGTISGVPTNPDSLLASFPATSSASSSDSKDKEKHEHWFTGQQVPTKEVECVLIWDEDLQSYKLERLDGTIKLAVDRAPRSSHHHQPAPSTSSTHPRHDRTASSSSSSHRLPASSPPDHMKIDILSSSDEEVRGPSGPPKDVRMRLNSNHSRNVSVDDGRSRSAARPAKADEVEDFGSFSLGSAPAPPEPVPSPVQPPSPPAASRVFTFPATKPPSKPPPAAAPPPPAVAPTLVPPPAAKSRLPPPKPPTKISPPRPVAASKRPPEPAPAPPARQARASKKPPPPAQPRPPARARRRSSVSTADVPAPAPAPAPPPVTRQTIGTKTIPIMPSGSDDSSEDDDDDEEEEEESDEESENPTQLARPGSVLSRNAAAGAGPAPGARAAKTLPPKIALPSAVVSDEDDEDSDASGDDESDFEDLEATINASLASRRRNSMGSTSAGRVGNKGPVSNGGRVGTVGRKGPAPPTPQGRVASKGIARKGPAPPSTASHWQQEMEDDVPESSEEDD